LADTEDFCDCLSLNKSLAEHNNLYQCSFWYKDYIKV
jgi:hypothetical protein